MCRAIVLALLMPLLAACQQPVMFSVSVDEPVKGGRLILNGKSANLMRNVDGHYWAKWNGADASGRIDIEFPDGSIASCRIGYVTNGMLEIQHYAVTDRLCAPVAS